jgi:aminoglycoside/choline kinase family phosphotransferase
VTKVDKRLDQLQDWLTASLAGMGLSGHFQIYPASADASFRRYFRVVPDDLRTSYVAMDAPPEQEDCRPFIAIATAMADTGVHVPEIIAINLAAGFLLLSDLGDRQYLPALNDDSVETLYGDALQALLLLQQAAPPQGLLPAYSRELLLAEMNLFPEWFIRGYLNLAIAPEINEQLNTLFQKLADQALAQPQVWVHRDYHSRNLMLLDAGDMAGRKSGIVKYNPGILDFQDAVVGPVCYDLVSLLRDCYVHWPATRVEGWVSDYYNRLLERRLLPAGTSLSEFRRWFDWMGVQRHLKAIGIFARLKLRDDKPGYISDIPRTLRYILQVGQRYPELAPLQSWLESDVVPVLSGNLDPGDDYFSVVD